MIPQMQDDIRQDFTVSSLSSRTFRLSGETQTITGMLDGIEALKQAVFLILNTERYEWLIHSWNYGFERKGLMGQPVSFVLPEIERRVREALLQDDRITDVRDFTFDIQKKKVLASFAVVSIFGSLSTETEVNI